MRNIVAFGSAALLAVVFVQCTSDGEVGGQLSSDVDGGAGPTLDGAVDGADDGNDAAPEGSSDAGRCSVDGWCREPLPTKRFDLKALWSFASNDVFAVGDDGMVHWDGSAWTIVDAPAEARLVGLTSLWSNGPNDLWGVMQGMRRIVHGRRANAGDEFTWTATTFDEGPSFDVLRGFGTKDLWVKGVDSRRDVFVHGVIPDVSADADAEAAMPSWSRVDIDAGEGFYVSSFGATENGELWATTWMDSAIVVHGVPSAPGSNAYVWEQSLNTAGMQYAYFLALWTPSADDIWAIGIPGIHFHRGKQSDGALAWSPVVNHTNINARAVWGSGKDDIWTVGEGAGIRHWDGATWSLSQVAVGGTPIYDPLVAVHGVGADVWAVGPGVTLHHVGSPGAQAHTMDGESGGNAR